MYQLNRRTLLTGVIIGAVSLAGCTGKSNSSSGEKNVIVDRTLTPRDGNPATVGFNASSGSTLLLEVDSSGAAVIDIFDPSTGTSLATVGEGVVKENRGSVETASVPDSADELTLGVVMKPDARANITITESDGGTASEKTSLSNQVETVRSLLEGTGSEQVASIGPLWVKLIEEQRKQGNFEIPAETVNSLHATVYGAIANLEAATWMNKRVADLADILTTAAVTAVSAKTGVPAGIIEDPLHSEIKDALERDSVVLSRNETIPKQLDATGGALTVNTTLSIDLSIQDVGVTINAPLQLEANIDGKNIPILATITNFSVLTEQVTVN